jgi:hypothetical protein
LNHPKRKPDVTSSGYAVTALLCAAATAWSTPAVTAQDNAANPEIRVEQRADEVAVFAGEELFTAYRTTAEPSPVLYPLNAPGGLCLVRHYPFRDDVEGESPDHPHHRSIWLAHGDVNGLDFWSGKAVIRNRSTEMVDEEAISVVNDWMKGDEVLCTEQTTLRFAASVDRWRSIELESHLVAGAQPVTFGDTKEGTLGVRTHPLLQLVDAKGNSVAMARNSGGIQGAEIWGKPARWVHYENAINGETYGISVLNHPASFRHPTLWHARDYGLVAANPFALHEMTGVAAGSGNHTLQPSETFVLRHAIVAWRGTASDADIEAVYQQFASGDE